MAKDKPSTIADVAAAVGVSKTTVSRYLNGKMAYMSVETREKIAAAIQTLQYRPSQAARTLKMKNTRVLGCIIADITNPFSSILVKGVGDMCDEKGYQLLMANTGERPQKEKDAIEALVAQGVEGLIVNATGQTNERLEQLQAQGIPVVVADRGTRDAALDTVETNNDLAIDKGMLHLKEQGFASVGFFTQGPTLVTTRIQRCEAFASAAQKLGMADNCQTYSIGIDDMDRTVAALQKMQELPYPRAIFTTNGVTTLHILQVMKQEGWRVPEDFGLLSFDDWGWMDVVSPSISAIRQDSYSMGRCCVELVLDRIEADKRVARHIKLNAELMERESTQINS